MIKDDEQFAFQVVNDSVKTSVKHTNVIYDPFFSDESLGTGYGIEEVRVTMKNYNKQVLDEVAVALGHCKTIDVKSFDSTNAMFVCAPEVIKCHSMFVVWSSEVNTCDYPHELEAMVESVCQPIHDVLTDYPYSYTLYAVIGCYSDD